ncbi:MAG: hypothetical protein JNL05_02185 [Flavobacteriales bacterium]|nr:hypothetical protein [Flavobacteriales bacterium]
MLLVLLGWLLLLVGTVPIGHAFLRRPSFRSEDEVNDNALVHPFLAGLAAACTWSMCWAMFGGLGAWALVAWLCLSLAATWAYRDTLAQLVGARWRTVLEEPRGALALRAALAVVALMGSAAPSELVDEGWYILPYLRWLEEHGAVHGIAQLEDRFGFNSAVHSAGALFSLHWAWGPGLYDLNGLMLLLVGSWFAGGVSRLIRSARPLLSDLLCGFFLLFLLRNMLTGPRSDLPAMLLSELMLVMLVRRIEAGTALRDDRSFRSLALYGAMLPAIKLSSALFSLIPAGILVGMVIKRSRVPWAWLLAIGSAVLGPWTAMNVRVSGYLVYPLYQVDLVDVDWKLPERVVRQQYYYVSEFARTNAKPEDSERLHLERTLRDWVPVWFARENRMNRATAVLLAASILVLLAALILKAPLLWRHHRALLWTGGLLVLNDVWWFLHAPAFRFGWAAIMGTIVFALYAMLGTWRNGLPLRAGTLALLAVITVQNVWKGFPAEPTALVDRVIVPAPAPTVPYRTGMLHGVEVHEVEGEFCWATPPPCLARGFDRHVRPRGTRLRDGFRYVPGPIAPQPVAP